ncbi:hypothetical protein FGL86_03250 [Pistricoccus aurantiacus]|uniref:Lipoprotein n=1 Tax=Pistricoccus aurantiacus TaxID=1883414 RepID=A0A5B8SPR0_9GAMM|nr:hypothetical protein [Pistricoccus aurantiacus]QEA38184.1 hypothetical protein FGL86_03250 [Pistricoccus aurantiacus]
MKSLIHLSIALTLAVLIGGCASSGGDPVPSAYNPHHSYDLPQTEGFYLDKQPEEERFAYQGLMTNMLATASTALLLSSNAGLGYSLGKSFGIGLAATMLEPLQNDEPKGASEVAPALQPMTMTPQQMQAYLQASLQQASLQALASMGVPQATIKQGMQYKAFYDQASQSKLVASQQDGCIKMINDKGEGACVLSLQFQPPVQPLNPQNPMFANTRLPPGYFGL